MFGIGYQEMLLIGLAALLLFGPGKLPEVMSQAGKWYKQFRDVTSELSGEFNKTVAEAKGELDAMGVDLGPMQKQVNSISRSVEKDLGVGNKKTTTTGKKTTTTTAGKKTGTSSASKSTTASKAGGKTTSTRASGSAAKTGNSSASKTTKSNMTSGKPVVVATKEDPVADLSLFEQAERKPKRRARAATPSAFTDLTPRAQEAGDAMPAEAVVEKPAPISIDPNDPVARARQRRMKAGYTQATA